METDDDYSNESNGLDDDDYADYLEEEELEMILNEMYDFEETFELKEKENGKYYLGMYMNIQDIRLISSGFLVGETPLMFFGNAISTELFFKYKFSHIITYLKSIIMCRKTHPVLDIMQLIISEDGLYLAIIKTYWISLIQRHWKKIMRQKKEYMEKQKCFQYIRENELGKRKQKPNFSLIGMLSIYRK